MMAAEHPYSINLDVRFDPLDLIGARAPADACKDPRYNQTLCRVNEQHRPARCGSRRLPLAQARPDDKFFYVVDSRFIIDLEGRTVELAPRQGFTMPRGVLHRTGAPERAIILMAENASLKSTGD
jgi:hypothetical protein